MKIPFDIKYRPQIESGDYKVETNDHHSVRIICWNKNTGGLDRIVALVAGGSGQEKTLHYTEEGLCVSSGGNKNKDLFIITPEPELSEFEQEVRVCVTKNLTTHIKDGNGREMSSTVFIDDDTAKKLAAELLELARNELEPEVLERLEAAYKNQDEVVYENGKRDGKAEDLKDLPRWRKWGNGACGNSDGHPIAIVSGAGGIRFVSVLSANGEKYIMLNDLKKLPGFNED